MDKKDQTNHQNLNTFSSSKVDKKGSEIIILDPDPEERATKKDARNWAWRP
jgi:hypothetical protein